MWQFMRDHRDFCALSLGNFFFYCGFSSFFLLPGFMKDLGADKDAIGYVMGLFGISAVGMIVITGFLLRRYGERSFMLVASVIMLIFSLLYLYIPDFGWTIYTLRFFQGVAFGLFVTPAATAVAFAVPSRELRHSFLTTFALTAIASFCVGPFFGEIIIEQQGYPTFFIYASAFNVLAFVCCYFYRDKDHDHTYTKRFVKDIADLMSSERFAVLITTSFILAVALGSMLHFFHIHLKQHNLGMRTFFLVCSVGAIFMRIILVGKDTDNVARRKIALPAIFLLLLSVLVAFFVQNFINLIFVSLVFSVGYGLAYPTINTMIMDRAHTSEKAVAASVITISHGMGVNSFAIILGLMVHNFGFFMMYLLVSVMLLFGIVMFTYKYFIDLARKGAPA